VNQAVLWDGVVVETDARVTRAVLADGVCIKAGEVVEDAVVVRNDLGCGHRTARKGT
jgi:ADP-glucose pyrophosphorylase